MRGRLAAGMPLNAPFDREQRLALLADLTKQPLASLIHEIENGAGGGDGGGFGGSEPFRRPPLVHLVGETAQCVDGLKVGPETKPAHVEKGFEPADQLDATVQFALGTAGVELGSSSLLAKDLAPGAGIVLEDRRIEALDLLSDGVDFLVEPHEFVHRGIASRAF